MTCKEYNKCDLRKHMEKILGLNETKEEDKIKLKELLNKTCCDKGMDNSEQCSLQTITCCSHFPNCSTVLSRRSSFQGDLIRLALFTCTSLGTGRCEEMLKNDVNLIFAGEGHRITIAKDITKKFEGI